jgi:hypothetical protein
MLLDASDADLINHKPLGAMAGRFNILRTLEKLETAVLDPKNVIGNDLTKRFEGQTSLALQKVRQMIYANEDINARNRQMCTPLHIAAQQGLGSAIEALIACKADAMAMDKNSKSVLEYAANDECRRVLKSHGVDGWQPLMTAAEAGELPTLISLLEGKAQVNIQSKSGTTPLHLAAQHGHIEILYSLLSAKADLNSLDRLGRSPLDVADTLIHLPNIHKHVLSHVKDHKDYGCNLCSRIIADGVCYSCGECGFDVCTTCFKQQKAGCRLNLQLEGADGWTPLMIAAERGPREVDMYLRFREALLCVRNRAQFPGWFYGSVNHYENLQQMDWTWDECEPTSITTADDKLTVQKVDEPPDYSCALGSYEFNQGVHVWKVLVKNVRSMWLGIARGVTEHGGLASYPGNQSEYMLAFGSTDGEPVTAGLPPIIEKFSNAGYSSGQVVEFELDASEHSLKMSIDGNIAVHAKDVSDKGVRAYVCMDYEESATIISKTAIMRGVNQSSAVSDSDREAGFSNALWSEEEDDLLAKELAEGDSFPFSDA